MLPFYKQNKRILMGNDCEMLSCYIEQKGLINDKTLFLIEGVNLTNLMHSLVGAILFKNNHNQTEIGSFCLISPDSILTAAHNFYKIKEKLYNKDFRLYFGDGVTDENYHQIQSFKILQEYTQVSQSKKLAFDFAFGKLKQPIKREGFLQLQQTCQKCLKDQNNIVEIYGYPANYEGNLKASDKQGEKRVLRQYGLSRKGVKLEIQNEKVTYNMCTYPGQSGCPVVIANKIVALHTGSGREGQNFNVGRLITKDLIETLKKWSKQTKTQPFSTSKCQHFGGRRRKLFENIEEKADLVFSQGMKAYEKQNYEVAQKKFLHSVYLQQKLNGYRNIHTARALTYIGAAYEKQGKEQQAVKKYMQSSKIYQKYKKTQELQNCQNLNNIGWIYYKKKKIQQAIANYEKCLNIITDKKGPRNQFNAAVLCNLAVAYQEQKKYSEAIVKYKESIKIYQQLQDKDWEKSIAIKIVQCLKAINETDKMKSIIRLYSLQSEVF